MAELAKEFTPFQLTHNGRWAFAGSRNPMGYATAEDAQVEWLAQRENRYAGPLNTEQVPNRVNNKTHRTELADLMDKGFGT